MTISPTHLARIASTGRAVTRTGPTLVAAARLSRAIGQPVTLGPPLSTADQTMYMDALARGARLFEPHQALVHPLLETGDRL